MKDFIAILAACAVFMAFIFCCVFAWDMAHVASRLLFGI